MNLLTFIDDLTDIVTLLFGYISSAKVNREKQKSRGSSHSQASPAAVSSAAVGQGSKVRLKGENIRCFFFLK